MSTSRPWWRVCSSPKRASPSAKRCAPSPRGRPLLDLLDLLDLADWLREWGGTHVAMESTGVDWKPIYNLLEDPFTVLVVNAQHITAVPGRKTAVAEREWIADWRRHGVRRQGVGGGGGCGAPASSRRVRNGSCAR